MRRLQALLGLLLAFAGTTLAWAHPPIRSAIPVITFQTETTNWAAQVVTNGGTISYGQEYYVDQFLVLPLKNASLWASIDDIWLLCSENSVQALTSLKGLRLATVTSAPTFTAKQGYTFNGTSNFIDTTFNFSTMASAGTPTAFSHGGYYLNNLNSSNFAYGVRGSSASSLIGQVPRTGSTLSAANLLTTNASNSVTGPSTSLGFFTADRASGPTYTIYRNGSSLGTFTPTGNTTTFVSQTLYIGGQNNNGTAASFAAYKIGFVYVGGDMNSTNQATLAIIVNGYMRTQGANQF